MVEASQSKKQKQKDHVDCSFLYDAQNNYIECYSSNCVHASHDIGQKLCELCLDSLSSPLNRKIIDYKSNSGTLLALTSGCL